jgi:hypothetical protein
MTLVTELCINFLVILKPVRDRFDANLLCSVFEPYVM